MAQCSGDSPAMSSTKECVGGEHGEEAVNHGSHEPVGEHRSESGREGNEVTAVLSGLQKGTEPIAGGAVVPSGRRVYR